MFQVSGSESIITGVAPKYVIGCVDAQKVKLCTSTSSPGFTPAASRPRCTAAVPEESAITRFPSPTKSSKSFSNPFTFGPSGTTQFVSNASLMYFCSIPS